MQRAEKIASACLVAFGLFVAYYSREYLKLGILISPGAGFFPFWIGVALTALGAVWMLATFLTVRATGPADSACGNLVLHRFLPAVLLIVLYAWLERKLARGDYRRR